MKLINREEHTDSTAENDEPAPASKRKMQCQQNGRKRRKSNTSKKARANKEKLSEPGVSSEAKECIYFDRIKNDIFVSSLS